MNELLQESLRGRGPTGTEWKLNEVLLAETSLSTSYQSFTEEESVVSHPSRKYEDASLLVREGRDNEKFSTRPKGVWSKRCYAIVHYPVWYWINFATALALMGLALMEESSIYTDDKERKEKKEHLIVELSLLIMLGINLVLRLVWLRPRAFFTSRATFSLIVLCVMFCEAFVILARNERHFRLTRALRPVLLLDSFPMASVRRVIRQIILCIKYIFDVMIVLFFMAAIFSLMGYFLFAKVNLTYFGSLEKSFVSMFVTLTTANHPDVFMESYLSSPAAPLFFMIYLLINLYYFSNVLLAVVFAKFKEAEKYKYKKLFIHRRKALQGAFEELKNEHETINLLDFILFMLYLKPQQPEHEVICVFKALQSDRPDSSDLPHDCLSAEEFSCLFQCLGMKWDMIHKSGHSVVWYVNTKFKLPRVVLVSLKSLHVVVRHWLFDAAMSVVVFANLLFLLLYTSQHRSHCSHDDNPKSSKDYKHFCSLEENFPGFLAFNSIYVAEVMVRLILDGPVKYYRKWWNSMDFFLVTGSFLCLCLEALLFDTHPEVGYLSVVRPLVLLRLLKLKRNYFFLIKIMVVLMSRLVSILFLLFVVFYSYSIVGMEVFSGRNHTVYPGCCEDAWFGVGKFYSNNGSDPDNAGLYWLNNFDNITHSYVTLFEEMVVNNWFIQMEGFVSTTSSAARIYFILFWVTTTVVLNSAIVFMVDAFESGILALSKSGKATGAADQQFSYLKKVAKVRLSEGDLDVLNKSLNVVKAYDRRWKPSFRRLIRQWKRISPNTILKFQGEFRGKRNLSNEDLSLEMYSAEIQEWLRQMKHNRKDVPLELSFRNQVLANSWWRDLGTYTWKKTKEFVTYLLE